MLARADGMGDARAGALSTVDEVEDLGEEDAAVASDAMEPDEARIQDLEQVVGGRLMPSMAAASFGVRSRSEDGTLTSRCVRSRRRCCAAERQLLSPEEETRPVPKQVEVFAADGVRVKYVGHG